MIPRRLRLAGVRLLIAGTLAASVAAVEVSARALDHLGTTIDQVRVHVVFASLLGRPVVTADCAWTLPAGTAVPAWQAFAGVEMQIEAAGRRGWLALRVPLPAPGSGRGPVVSPGLEWPALITGDDGPWTETMLRAVWPAGLRVVALRIVGGEQQSRRAVSVSAAHAAQIAALATVAERLADDRKKELAERESGRAAAAKETAARSQRLAQTQAQHQQQLETQQAAAAGDHRRAIAQRRDAEDGAIDAAQRAQADRERVRQAGFAARQKEDQDFFRRAHAEANRDQERAAAAESERERQQRAEAERQRQEALAKAERERIQDEAVARQRATDQRDSARRQDAAAQAKAAEQQRQAAREQAAREQAARESADRERRERDEAAARERAAREQAERERVEAVARERVRLEHERAEQERQRLAEQQALVERTRRVAVTGDPVTWAEGAGKEGQVEAGALVLAGYRLSGLALRFRHGLLLGEATLAHHLRFQPADAASPPPQWGSIVVILEIAAPGGARYRIETNPLIAAPGRFGPDVPGSPAWQNLLRTADGGAVSADAARAVFKAGGTIRIVAVEVR